jgi:large subunit ribosomal protein L19
MAKTEVKETNLIRRVTVKAANKNVQNFDVGDTVNVFVKIKEGEKERIQAYKGIVIKIQGSGAVRSFTVRKMSSGIGVERSFPLSSPIIDRVETLTKGKVRRSKLYFLRGLEGKAAKIESELVKQTKTAE